MINILSVRDMVNEINIKVAEYYKVPNSDPYVIELNILEQYPDFYDKYPFLVKKICKGEDLTILYKMIDNIDLVNKGEDNIKDVERRLGEELAEIYLHPNDSKKSTIH